MLIEGQIAADSYCITNKQISQSEECTPSSDHVNSCVWRNPVPSNATLLATSLYTLNTSMLIEHGDSGLHNLQGYVPDKGYNFCKTVYMCRNESTCTGIYFSCLRSKLLIFSLRKLSTSLFILYFLECMAIQPYYVETNADMCINMSGQLAYYRLPSDK